MTHETKADLQLLSSEQRVNNSKTSTINSVITWFSCILALGALGGCLYLALHISTDRQTQTKMAQALTELQTALQKYKEETGPMPDNLDAVLQDVTDQIRNQSNTTKDLESLVVSDFKPKLDFLLKEYEELQERQPVQQFIAVEKDNTISLALITNILRSAELYLSVLQDVKMTNNLLVFAEHILQDINDPAYLNLQEAIIKDKQTIATITMPDKEMIWHTLDNLTVILQQYADKQQAHDQRFSPGITKPKMINDSAKIKISDQENTSFLKIDTIASWRKALKKTWHELRSLIKIKHQDSDLATMATSVTLAAMQQTRIQMLFEQIRFASFYGDPKLYHIGLTTAREEVTKYFAADHALSKQVIADLDTLAMIDIKPALPQQLRSFTELATILKETTGSTKQ